MFDIVNHRRIARARSRFNRREFMACGAAAAIYPWLKGCAPGDVSDGLDTRIAPERLIVVGAGIAGLAAASRLASAGHTVTVLEGRERIGGRLWTDRSLGVPLDLGAAWIHGPDGNPITTLASQFGLDVLEPDGGELIYSAGRLFTDVEIGALKSEAQIATAAAELLGEQLDEDLSIADAISQAHGALSTNAEWWLHSEIVVGCGAELEQLSLWYSDDDEGFAGEDVLFPQGYDQIATALATGLDIRLNQRVMAIEYGTEGVVVSTDSGSFTGDRAVITLPLGVLKSGGVTFSPGLPEAKAGAIARLDMGVLNKVMLRFGESFWPDGAYFLGNVAEPIGAFGEFFVLQELTGAPVLAALVGGDFARSIEDETDEQIVSQVMSTLRSMFGGEVPDPDGAVVTRWASDPFTLGSYSVVPVGASSSDYDVVAEPIEDRIFFAGEATSRAYPGTVHGAYLSGISAADAIRVVTNG